MWGDIIIAFLLAFITSFAITPETIRIAKKVGAMDIPRDSRRIHKKATPKLGGLAILIGFLVSVAYLVVLMLIEGNINLFTEDEYGRKLLGFLLGIIIITIVGFTDDIKNIKPWQKLLGQIAAAIVVICFGIRVELNIPFISDIIGSEVFSIILTLGWIIGITNAINLIDGLDGLSSGISIISCLSMLIIFALNDSPIIAIIIITAIAGALIGFIPYNFNPAKTFMGDLGSNFLGYTISIVSILGIAKTYTAIVVVAPIIVLALPIFDTLFAIFRRLREGKGLKAIFQGDKQHLHHRLMNKGLSQKQAVWVLYGISATLGMFAIILFESGLWKAVSFGLMIAASMALGYKNIEQIKGEDTKQQKAIYFNMKKYVREQYLVACSDIIKCGGTVVLPTETVYGIGANALSEEAIKKIYEAKGREADNPLIVHVSDKKMLKKLVKDINKTEQLLIDKFMPGPLTLILNKQEIIPDNVTAGLSTVAIRMPSNKIANKLITLSEVPIAAPSANISGRPSGTNIEDIKQELIDRVDAIIDAGNTDIGIESTVVKVENGIPVILRPGKITKEDIEKVVGKVKIDEKILKQVSKDEIVQSPGMKYKHYAPSTKCVLAYSKDENEQIEKINNKIKEYKRVCVIGFSEHKEKINSAEYIELGSKDNLEQISKNIFSSLRKADKLKVDLIIVEGVAEEGIGLAIINRLLRACEYERI